MKQATLWALFLSFFVLSSAMATPPDENPEYLFEQGLKAYSDGNLEQAKEFYANAYTLEPNNPNLAYNLAVVFMAREEIGASIAMLRRAIHLSPTFSSARKALEKAFEKTSTQTASEKLTNYEVLRFYLLGRIPAMIFFFITAILFLFAGWTFIGWLGQRKRAKIDELENPVIPTSAIVLLSCLAISLFLTGFKVFDGFQTRGSIVEKNVELHSGPSSEHPKIAELFEGFDVIIKRRKDQWVQVQHPGGYSGWLDSSKLFEYSTDSSRIQFDEEK